MEACVSASDQAVDEFTCNDICIADRILFRDGFDHQRDFGHLYFRFFSDPRNGLRMLEGGGITVLFIFI